MRKTLTTLAATAVMLTTGAAFAQQTCAPRDVLTKRLAGTYGEVFSGGGLQNADAVFEVWTSKEDGTWTILMTRSDGTSCIMASGTAWRKALARELAGGVPS